MSTWKIVLGKAGMCDAAAMLSEFYQPLLCIRDATRRLSDFTMSRSSTRGVHWVHELEATKTA